MAAPLYTAFALRNLCNNLSKKSTCCFKLVEIPCRHMGFLGSLKWKGKKETDLTGPEDEESGESRAVQEVSHVSTIREEAPAKMRQCIEEVRGYKPPADVEERLQGLTEEIFGGVSDWKSQSLSDRYKKYKFLTRAISEFDHDISNFDLHSMSKIEDVVKYFQTEVRDTTKLEDLSKLDLPKNLHMNIEPVRFDPDTVADGKSVFPREKTVIPSVKYRRKYKGYEGKIRWK